MFDKWKAKKELIKAFTFYRKEYNKAYEHYRYTFDTEYLNKNYDAIDEAYNDMKSLEDIVKALAYLLYSNFHMSGMEDGCWIKTYYDLYKNEGKKYVEKIRKENDDIYEKFAKEDDEWNKIYKQAQQELIAWHTDNFFEGNYSKGDVIYNMENGCLYKYDGKNFINMC